MDRNQIICVCQDITAGEIIDAIQQYGCLEEVKRRTRACVTCFGCEMELEELFEEYSAEVSTLGGAGSRLSVLAGRL